MIDILGRGFRHAADKLAVGGVQHAARLQPFDLAGQQRLGREFGLGIFIARRVDQCQRRRVGQVEPGRIAPFGGKEVRPLADRLVRQARQHRLHRVERAGGDLFGRDILIHDLVHEGGVGAVFQKPADEIGQKVAMRADRRIDAAAGLFALQHDVMQPFAHAVQALELERFARAHVDDRGDGMGVVGGELRVDAVGHGQQLFRIGDVADIGRFLAGEDREILQPHHLRALDLGIPIGAFHQPHHDLAVEPLAERIEPVEHRARTAAVSLHDDAEAIPAGKVRVRQHGLDHLQRQSQPVGLLRVDVETHPRLGGLKRQLADHRHQFLHHARFLCHLVARMQRRKLDRNARVVTDIVAFCGRGNGGDGLGIGLRVTFGILGGFRGLAQHVVGIGIALRLHLRCAFHRGVDGFAQNELAAHFLHRLPHRAADDGFAETLHRAAQMADDARVLVFLQHLAGQHQRPGGGVDERGGGMTQMLAPVRRRDLVLDQRVHRVGVRHAQQRLGQTHERDALFGRQAILGEEDLHQAGTYIGADLADKRGALVRYPGPVGRAERGPGNQPFQKRAFGLKRAGVDCSPEIGHGVLRVNAP